MINFKIHSKNTIWILVNSSILFIAVIIAALIYVSNNTAIFSQWAGQKTTSKITPTLIQTKVTPTKTPIDLQKYSIVILNGSGKKGLAQKTKIFLEEKGYKIISVGNANFRQITQIAYDESISNEILQKFKTELGFNNYIEKTEKPTYYQDKDIVLLLGSDFILQK